MSQFPRSPHRCILAWCRGLFFPTVIFSQELLVRFWAYGTAGNLLYTALFSLSVGSLFTLLSSLWGRRGNAVLSGILLGAVTLWFSIQTVYVRVFRTILTLYSLTGTGDVFQYWREMLRGIAQSALPLGLLLIPLIFYLIWGRRFVPEKRTALTILLPAASAVTAHALALGLILAPSSALMTPKYLYFEEFLPEQSVSTFGMLTTLRLDLRQLLGIDLAPSAEIPEIPEIPETPSTPTKPETPSTPQDPAEPAEPQTPAEPEVPKEPEVPEEAPKVYEPNVLEIDFAALSKSTSNKTHQNLDAYFANREPTLKNEYTGRFAGKNLIWFTAEGFSRFAVDPELTPTLYRLANSGFVFENFYNPLWWASTLDGEYAALTGMIPKAGVWSLKKAGENNGLYFSMGHRLREMGYETRAYHNHDYDYYDRHISHPALGYDYKGVGLGLDVTYSWPESDVEMMQKTLPEVVGDTPFHAYYLTVSGHMPYDYVGNQMAFLRRKAVAHLDMSENARAYLACQQELDAALQYTLEYLEQTGHLEDTVICLSADHYPYGLDPSVIEELAGGPVDMDCDVMRSTLILWSADMAEPVRVEKLCTSLDILPTLLNLFGVEYDSRLLIGRDILSTAPGLAVFSNRSFLTDAGYYNGKTNRFSPAYSMEDPASYASAMLKEVNKMFSNSKSVLESNYYHHLGLIPEPVPQSMTPPPDPENVTSPEESKS